MVHLLQQPNLIHALVSFLGAHLKYLKAAPEFKHVDQQILAIDIPVHAGHPCIHYTIARSQAACLNSLECNRQAIVSPPSSVHDRKLASAKQLCLLCVISCAECLARERLRDYSGRHVLCVVVVRDTEYGKYGTMMYYCTYRTVRSYRTYLRSTSTYDRTHQPPVRTVRYRMMMYGTYFYLLLLLLK